MSDYWLEQCDIFKIKDETVPAYHPKANRMVERWHRTIKTVITKMCSNSQDRLQRLPMIMLGLRAKPHLDSGLSPTQDQGLPVR